MRIEIKNSLFVLEEVDNVLLPENNRMSLLVGEGNSLFKVIREGRINKKTSSYSYLEKLKLLEILRSDKNTWEKKLELLKDIVYSTGSSKLIKSYLELSIDTLRLVLSGDTKKTIEDYMKDDGEVILGTGRSLSVFKFIQEELIGCEIYNDNQVKFNKVTANSSLTIPSGWYKVTGILGNKTRANLSLTIGEGVDKALNIVFDSKLNNNYLEVRATSEKITRWKKYRGLVEPGRSSTEVVINLESLPILSRRELSKAKHLNEVSLGRIFGEYYTANIITKYLDYYQTLQGTSSGIANSRERVIPEGDIWIETKRVSSYDITVKNVRSNRNVDFHNYYHGGSPINAVIKKILDSIDLRTKSVEELKKEWRAKFKESEKELRNTMFLLIHSKEIEKWIGKNINYHQSMLFNINLSSVTVKYEGR